MLHKILRGIAPVVAIAFAASLSGCDRADIRFNDSDGVPLSELDMSGEAPREIVVAGPDHVLLAKGSKLDIDVSGDDYAIETLRFTLKDGTLAITRNHGPHTKAGLATIRVTMPLPEKAVVAGSGSLEMEGVARKASLVIAGSGKVRAHAIESEQVEIVVAGSGTIEAAGNVDKLDLNIAGSGRADMRALKADKADISIAGSGAADFASDGVVKANIVGSGDVRVTGAATCTVKTVGSGTLTCKPAAEAQASATEPKAKPKQAKKKGGSGPAKA